MSRKLSMVRNILERSNIQVLRECLIQGDNQEAVIKEDYDQRLQKSYDDIDRFLEKCGPENDFYSDELMSILDEQVNIYMEVGIKAGFLLAIDIMKR